MDAGKMFLESPGRYPLEETLQRLTEAATAAGWRVTHTHDLGQTMLKNGFSVHPMRVMELCNPQYAHRILSEDSLRIFASMMPCRIAVYEKADGRVYLSRMNNGAFAALIGGVVEETMSKAYRDVESFLDAVVE